MSQTDTFLGALFGEKPERAAVQVWHRSQPALTWVLDDLEKVARKSVEGAEKHDVYVACGLAPHAEDRPRRTRLKAQEVVGIPGVWADIDINGGPEQKTGAAPTEEAARQLSGELLEPSLLIGSGYGLQAWWLFEGGPWMFPTTPEQEQAQRIVSGFQGALRAAARRHGYGLDSTQDLARVMRIPGTFNHKGEQPVPVELVEMGGKTYSVEELAELGQGFAVASEARVEALETGEELVLQVRLNVPLDSRLKDLMVDEPDFKATWEMRAGVGSKRRGWSASEFEFSICNWLVRAGLDPQQVCDVLVHWRNIIEPGDPRGKNRAERLARTIGKVINTVSVEYEKEFAETNRETALASMEAMAHRSTEPSSQAKAMANLNKIVGGPEIASLKQYSRDPNTARFAVVLADGRELNIGLFSNFLTYSRFRPTYAIATGHLPPVVKQAAWEKAVAQLLRVADVIDDVEDSRAGEMRAWLEDYVDSQGSEDRDGACASNAPFIENGAVHVALSHFMRYLRRVVGERVDGADVAAELRSLGFERTTVAFKRSSGARSTRSYFERGWPV